MRNKVICVHYQNIKGNKPLSYASNLKDSIYIVFGIDMSSDIEGVNFKRLRKICVTCYRFLQNQHHR